LDSPEYSVDINVYRSYSTDTMKRIYFYAIPLALLLVMIGGLTTGCEGLFSGLTPPASEYPADIIGRVTIADKLIADGEEVRPYGINTLYWIVEF
jgi:hypothetical protein